MCLANEITLWNGMQYSAAEEYTMKNLWRKLPFGAMTGPQLMETNAEAAFVDQVAGLEDLEAPYLIVGAIVKEENGVRSMQMQEEVQPLTGNASAMDVAWILRHPPPVLSRSDCMVRA